MEENGTFTVEEFCNSAYGYELVLDTKSAVNAGASAVIYDGVRHEIIDEDESLSLRSIDQAHRGTYSLELIAEGDVSLESVSLRYLTRS